MRLEELKDALATYGVNPQERNLEVYLTDGRPVIAVEIDEQVWLHTEPDEKG